MGQTVHDYIDIDIDIDIFYYIHQWTVKTFHHLKSIKEKTHIKTYKLRWCYSDTPNT